MNKNFLSLLLIAAVSISASSFAAVNENEKEVAKTVAVDEVAQPQNSSVSAYIEKLATPMTKAAVYVANNAKAALAVEVTGVLALSYIIYQSFFASQEDEEDFS